MPLKRLKKATPAEHTAISGSTAEQSPAALDFQAQFSAYMAKIGAKGGKIGGKRRLETMTHEQRSAIALKAVRARWTKEKAKKRS